jgi:hypothetical protein
MQSKGQNSWAAILPSFWLSRSKLDFVIWYDSGGYTILLHHLYLSARISGFFTHLRFFSVKKDYFFASGLMTLEAALRA